MTTRITYARSEDVNAAQALSRLHAECLGAAWSEAEIGALLRRKEICCIMGMDAKNAATGFILFQCVGDEGEILNMGVTPAARRQGIGAQLLTEALAYCRKHQVKALWLEVAEDNMAALGLYEKQGFARQGRRKGYYAAASGPKDAITCRKLLED